MIYYDFGFYLTIGTLVTGVITLIDKYKWRPQRVEKGLKYDEKGNEVMPFHVDISRSIFPIIFVILILRSFIYEPYRIPSASMNPGLYAGDFITVNKYAYGIRLPITNTQIIPVGEPQRGDVIVFHPPNLQDPTKAIQDAYIKRLYGLPGDTLSWNKGVLTITPKCGTGESCAPIVVQAKLKSLEAPELVREDNYDFNLFEQSIGEKNHELLFVAKPYLGALGNEWSITIPKDKYFAMGDHRDNSTDARAWYQRNPNAFIDREAIIGRAAGKWLYMTFKDTPDFTIPLFDKPVYLPRGISFDRVGTIN
ncbi:signal peptidase I [Kangiella sp. HZ709]|uniref:signal peptidase I n=1 Tax=Kangiella sp. HZ709 TaxID=2666328 RepID=UPI0012AFCDFD|nr:signal peptidase I [Kangiella sp. HZ709]MRX27348.1 signal peptidase I [Kangiella sp. HZ709]